MQSEMGGGVKRKKWRSIIEVNEYVVLFTGIEGFSKNSAASGGDVTTSWITFFHHFLLQKTTRTRCKKWSSQTSAKAVLNWFEKLLCDVQNEREDSVCERESVCVFVGWMKKREREREHFALSRCTIKSVFRAFFSSAHTSSSCSSKQRSEHNKNFS